MTRKLDPELAVFDGSFCYCYQNSKKRMMTEERAQARLKNAGCGQIFKCRYCGTFHYSSREEPK